MGCRILLSFCLKEILQMVAKVMETKEVKSGSVETRSADSRLNQKHAENEGGNALMCCFESDVSMRCRRKLVSVFWAFDSMLRMRTHSRSHSLSQPFSDVLKAFLEMLKEVEAEILLPERRKGII